MLVLGSWVAVPLLVGAVLGVSLAELGGRPPRSSTSSSSGDDCLIWFTVTSGASNASLLSPNPNKAPILCANVVPGPCDARIVLRRSALSSLFSRGLGSTLGAATSAGAGWSGAGLAVSMKELRAGESAPVGSPKVPCEVGRGFCLGVASELPADHALCSLAVRSLPRPPSTSVSIVNSGAGASALSGGAPGDSTIVATEPVAGGLLARMKLYLLFLFELFELALIEMGRRRRSVGAPGEVWREEG